MEKTVKRMEIKVSHALGGFFDNYIKLLIHLFMAAVLCQMKYI